MTRLILALFIAAAMTSCVATPSQTTTTTTTTRQSSTGPAANAQSTAERIDTSGW